jgi:nucleoside-diphosphate-sugar epimerase
MLELPVDDPARRKPDISRARALLAWEPKVQLREGLELCLPYFREAAGAVRVPTAG